MENRNLVALILGLLVACCILLFCIMVALVLGYRFIGQSRPTPEPVLIIPQVPSTPSPSPSPTPFAACPDVMQQVLVSSQAGNYDPEPGITGDMRHGIFDTDIIPLVSYTVTGDELGEPSYDRVPSDLKEMQRDSATQVATWELFSTLIPQGQRAMVAEFVVFTDGSTGILAAVRQTYDDPDTWVLAVDAADVEDRNVLIFSLVHEFAHLLTLSSTQVEPDQELFDHPRDEDLYEEKELACSTYFPGEGCSLPDSYIHAFYDRFWPELIIEWQAVDDLADEQDLEEYYEELYAFYEEHKDEFVTDYAVTNPVEDVAESFSFFVLSPTPETGTVADEKILFFYEYPELVDLREQILQSLCEASQ
jgi:hypothetical protein